MGRTPGAKNVMGRDAKLAVQQAFEAMGGVGGLVEWAMRNPDAFYLHIWTKLIPKEVHDYYGEKQTIQAIVNAVNVLTPVDAVNILERLEDDRNSYSGDRREGDERQMDGSLPAHEVHLQEVNGSGTGSQQETYSPDAAPSREDDDDSEDTALSLPNNVPQP